MHSLSKQFGPLGSPAVSEAEVNTKKGSGKPTAIPPSDLKVLKLPRQVS